MKDQVIVTPLPMGNKTKTTTRKNYTQLLEANKQNKLETKWWNHFLAPMEEKYELIYHVGKNAMQVFYHQGKNMNANKEINNVVSNEVKKANNSWQEIAKVMSSFNNYRQMKFEPVIEKLSNELKPIIEKMNQVDVNSEEHKNLKTQQGELIESYKNNDLTKKINEEVDEEFKKYEKEIDKKMDEYFKKEPQDFALFLETITYKLPENSSPKKVEKVVESKTAKVSKAKTTKTEKTK